MYELILTLKSYCLHKKFKTKHNVSFPYVGLPHVFNILIIYNLDFPQQLSLPKYYFQNKGMQRCVLL